MAKPLHLTAAQQSQILHAGYALDPTAQRLLRQRVLAQLAAAPELGDGAVYRACRAVQRTLFVPPPDLSLGPRQLRKLD